MLLTEPLLQPLEVTPFKRSLSTSALPYKAWSGVQFYILFLVTARLLEVQLPLGCLWHIAKQTAPRRHSQDMCQMTDSRRCPALWYLGFYGAAQLFTDLTEESQDLDKCEGTMDPRTLWPEQRPRRN